MLQCRKMLRNVEKRGVHAAGNGPSPPSCVAKPETQVHWGMDSSLAHGDMQGDQSSLLDVRAV